MTTQLPAEHRHHITHHLTAHGIRPDEIADITGADTQPDAIPGSSGGRAQARAQDRLNAVLAECDRIGAETAGRFDEGADAMREAARRVRLVAAGFVVFDAERGTS